MANMHSSRSRKAGGCGKVHCFVTGSTGAQTKDFVLPTRERVLAPQMDSFNRGVNSIRKTRVGKFHVRNDGRQISKSET